MFNLFKKKEKIILSKGKLSIGEIEINDVKFIFNKKINYKKLTKEDGIALSKICISALENLGYYKKENKNNPMSIFGKYDIEWFDDTISRVKNKNGR